MDEPVQPTPPEGPPPPKRVIPPTPGESITSLATGCTYEMGPEIGAGHFAVVHACKDIWNNELAAKVLKPIGTYEKVRASAEAEVTKLMTLRHPYITFVYDAFEFRDTFYIVTERCHSSVKDLFSLPDFQGPLWLMPIARCLLQAVHYLHLNDYVHQDIHSGNVLAALVRDEMLAEDRSVIVFKLSDLGVARLRGDISMTNTRAQWMLPPEVLNPDEYGPLDHRLDIYHTGLLLLQLACSREIPLTQDEILRGVPRDMAMGLPAPLNFALEKALRRHVQYRTATAMELWRDLHSPPQLGGTAPPSSA